MEEKLHDLPANVDPSSRSHTDLEKIVAELELQVKEQKQLRLQDAKQVEAYAAKIKEFVANKLRDLEEQNKLLREQNAKCQEQLDLLRNHIALQSGRNFDRHLRSSLSLEVHKNFDFRQLYSRPRVSPGTQSLQTDLEPLVMDHTDLGGELSLAVENLSLSPAGFNCLPPEVENENETTHDYAEIYTPSLEKTPLWLQTAAHDGTISSNNSESLTAEFRPPTPPLHRVPSWEAKIYELAKAAISDSGIETGRSAKSQSQTMSVGYSDIDIPVYATVKGRASQIRSAPFSGDSTDSSDGEYNPMASSSSICKSSSTDNTESSGTATTASKRTKCLAQSPAKTDTYGSQGRKPKGREAIEIESTQSDDYAIPPDANTASEETLTMTGETLAFLMMRSSYSESPIKKTDSIEKSGYLHHLGGKLKTWRKRWFVLKNGVLSYWKNPQDVNSQKPQSEIILDDNCLISRADGASTFEINTGKKIFYLAADSNLSVDEWVRVLQNAQRRNAAKILLSREDQKPTVKGWVTRVKNGHAKKCWCILMGKMLLFFKGPADNNPIGQINMREMKVEEVEHMSDSDSDEREESMNQANLTISIYSESQKPTYLILPTKHERDNWIYHLTIVSGGDKNNGTQYEQLVQKLMEVAGDTESVMWRHPVLLYAKDPPSSPLTSLDSDSLQTEALKLFKSCQLFMSVAVSQPAIDYHVVLAQDALQLCLNMPKLQSEIICILVKQTSPHYSHKFSSGVQTCISSSLDCKSNPPAYSFVQGWQLLALAVSLFVPKNNRVLWYFKRHLSRFCDSKSDTGKYAIYCERALARTIQNGDREAKPSRMEVLSILLKNPYHHSLPHAIPVHFLNGAYQVVSFDGSTTIEEFQTTLTDLIGCRNTNNGFAIFSDDPIEKDLEHYLDPQAKVCDVISKWETALREKGSGKFENTRVIQLTFKNRLYWKNSAKLETDKEKMLLVYQTNQQVVQGRFPLSKELALELASLITQIEMGDCVTEKSKNLAIQALDKFYPYRYRDALSPEGLLEVQELLVQKWASLKGKSPLDCARIYITCARKWQFFGSALFQAQPKHSDQAMVWLAVSEDSFSVLELSSMAPLERYSYSNVLTFGGCQDDFMIVVSTEDGADFEKKLLFALSKPKILELTLLIANYMNALGHTIPGTPKNNSLTRNSSLRSIKTNTTFNRRNL